MIPKKIFFFWGNEKMSWARYMTLYSFRKLNPDWKIELYIAKSKMEKTWVNWNKHDFEHYDGADYFNKIEPLGIEVKKWEFKNPQGKSWGGLITPPQACDFFEWESLYKSGGIYADMDILFIKPIDGYYEQIKNHDAVVCYHKCFSIGFMASAPGCLLYRDLWQNAFRSWNEKEYQSAGAVNMYKLLTSVAQSAAPTIRKQRRYRMSRTRVVRPKEWRHIDMYALLVKRYPGLKIFNNPMSLVYPWSEDFADIWEKRHTTVPDGCVGIHWYAGNPTYSQVYNNILNADNFRDHKNTFCYFAESILNGREVQ